MKEEEILKILKKDKIKYKHILEAKKGELSNLHLKMLKDEYFPHIHITGYSGLVADPGAFVYYKGEYFLYYLWSPFHWIHGLKHWCLVSTKDFINYIQHGVAIMPSIREDKYGIYSGGGIVIDKKVWIYYTANVKKKGQKDHERKSFIARVSLNTKNYKTSLKKELLWTFDPSIHTPHFRDPKPIFIFGNLFFLVGAQKVGKIGNIAVFKQNKNCRYTFIKNLTFSNPLDTGYMLERPEFLRFLECDILIASLEGVEILKNTPRTTVYTIGKLDEKFIFHNNSSFLPLDYGHDFYVPTITRDDKSRYISIAWFGVSRVECYPTKDNMWANAMTLPRHLIIKRGKLLQQPLEELKNLREIIVKPSKMNIYNISNGFAYEFIFTKIKHSFHIRIQNNLNHNIQIWYKNNSFFLERKNMTIDYYPLLGTIRKIEGIRLKKIRLFLDASFLEVYLNDGEYVLTSRIFIHKMNKFILCGITCDIAYRLKHINVLWKDVLTNISKGKLEFKLPYY